MSSGDKHSSEGEIAFKEDAERTHSSAPRNASVVSSSHLSAADRARRNANAKLANPLSGYSRAQLQKLGRQYALEHALAEPEDIRAFEIGAMLAQDPLSYDRLGTDVLTDDEMSTLYHEFTNKWSQPKTLYIVIVCCSICAAVQGMGKYWKPSWSLQFLTSIR